MWGSIIGQRKSDGRTVKATDSNGLGVIVNYSLIGHVDMVRILRWPSIDPDWRRYFLSTAFRLATGGSGRCLKDAR